MADLPGAAEAAVLADALPFPAVEEVALVVPGRRGFDPVSHDGLVEGVAAVGRMGWEDLVSGSFHGVSTWRSMNLSF
jgi:hypothetical protein